MAVAVERGDGYGSSVDAAGRGRHGCASAFASVRGLRLVCAVDVGWASGDMAATPILLRTLENVGMQSEGMKQ